MTTMSKKSSNAKLWVRILCAVLAVLMIGNGFDDKVRERETKMFGYVSKPNQKSERESII